MMHSAELKTMLTQHPISGGRRALLLFCVLLFSGLALSHSTVVGQSAGTNYFVPHQSLNAGGGRSTNGVYSIDQSLGEWAPVLQSETNALNIRLGFAGQLNEAPIANSDSFSRTVDQSLVIPCSALLINDTDPEKDTLRLEAISPTSQKGIPLINNSTGIVYQPLAIFREADAFSYIIADSLGNVCTGLVSISIANAAPVLSNLPPILIFENETAQINLGAVDPDTPFQTLSYSLLTATAGFELNATNGIATWLPSENDAPSTNIVTIKVTDNGVPVLSATQSYSIIVQELNDPPVLPVIATQIIQEGQSWILTNAAVDLDIPINTLTYRLEQAPPGMSVDAIGVLRWLTGENDGPSTNVVIMSVTDNGIPEKGATNTFTIIVNEQNTPPALTGISNQIVIEGMKFQFGLSGLDHDIPSQQLTFSLLTSPTGMVFDASGRTLIWTPSEDQGPSTNVITVKVADNGIPSLSATQSFTLVVLETNTAPQLPELNNQIIQEGATLTITNTGTDSDIPTNTLAYSLVQSPAGMTISSNGILSWTPTEEQGPSSNNIVLIVTDNGTPALSATQQFTIVVEEINSTPQLPILPAQTINEGQLLVITNGAVDMDIPGNTLQYTLLQGPTGMTVNAQGMIHWLPGEADGPSSNNVVVCVSDNGIPPLAATNSFVVFVRESNSAPALSMISNRVVKAGELLAFYVAAADTDIPAQTITYQLEPGFPSGATIDSRTGLFSWTPQYNQGGQTYSLSVMITDNAIEFGSSNLTARASFSIHVMELPPVTNLFSINQDWVMTSNSFNIRWPSVVGASYRVDGKVRINDALWNPVSPVLLATNTNTAYAISLPNSNQFFGVASLGRISHSLLKSNQLMRNVILSTNAPAR